MKSEISGVSIMMISRFQVLAFTFTLTVLFPLLFTGCFAGGGHFKKGGHVYGLGFLPAATITRGAPYKIVCYDKEKAALAAEKSDSEKPADAETEKPSADSSSPATKASASTDPAPSADDQTFIYYKTPAEYTGECDQEGESSQFFLFNMFPATRPISPDLAVSQAVQRLEGDTMINIRTWHELHYYTVLGRVSVFKVRGTVIKFLSAQEQSAKGGKK
jgi:hypothetical protein